MLATFCSVISADELYKSFNVYKAFKVSSILFESPSMVNSFPLGYIETLNLSSNISRFLSFIPHIEIKDSLSLNLTLLSNIFLLIVFFLSISLNYKLYI